MLRATTKKPSSRVIPELEAPPASPKEGSSLLTRAPWLAVVLICSLAWGLNFPVSKLAFATESPLAPGAFDVVRFSLATVSIAPWLVESRSQWKAGAELGLYLSIGYIGQIVGLETEGAGEAGFICSLQVVFVSVAAMLAKGKKDVRGIASAVVAVIGVGMLEGVFEPGGLENLGPGVVPLLLQPLAFGAGYVRLEKIMNNGKDSTTARGVTAWQLAFTAIGCLAYSLVVEGPSEISEVVAVARESREVLVGLLYTAILGTSATISLQVEAFKRIPSSEASILLTTEPLVAAVGSALILSEPFDNWGAAALIVAASVITFTGKESPPSSSSSSS